MSQSRQSGQRIGGSPDGSLCPHVSCLNPRTLQASLVSTEGSHCEVWRGNRRVAGGATYEEFVLKFARDLPRPEEIALLARDHQRLIDALEDIVPRCLFFVSEIDGRPGLCVIAEAVDIWFNMANPQNREEAIALVQSDTRAHDQLSRFVAAAQRWRSSDSARLIDLFGVNNLVMDTQRQIRYLDSFYVYLFEDMPHLLAESDPQLEEKIDISVERLAYLEDVLSSIDSP